MKIATYNVNGVLGRLPVLLKWLKEDKPDVVCLQELKTTDDKFPLKELEKAGYGAVWQGEKSWNGVAILTRGQEPHLTRKGLPGDPDDTHSRYIEAAVDGVLIGGLYLPNGNPAPGPKWDYKLDWFRRLKKYAAELLELEVPVVLAGDYNVMPTDIDVYKPERWVDDALFRPEVRRAYADLIAQGGPTPSGICIRTNASIRSGNIGGARLSATRGCASTTSCSARPSPRRLDRQAFAGSRGVGSIQAITHPS
ncbi:exodeoxyribonuclease III [Rhizobium sp. S152]|uniref:exodeoxyribonuclease III n=1 Tax=Rhizobium sp. S152 TaxID=3055038 RepID=UPI0025AA13F0|nr:exodeoxyribonuclease III [Rhizobium sp. S152]MDM9627832.1 exodeoxyribonuclease III [Rhizobium sp. S152]